MGSLLHQGCPSSNWCIFSSMFSPLKHCCNHIFKVKDDISYHHAVCSGTNDHQRGCLEAGMGSFIVSSGIWTRGGGEVEIREIAR